MRDKTSASDVIKKKEEQRLSLLEAQRGFDDAIDNFRVELYRWLGVDRLLKYIVRKLGGGE